MNKLAILITVMLCFSLSVMADNQPKIKLKSKVVKIFTRSPLYLDVEVCESGQDLQIFFRGNLPDANVVVFDDEGNVVLHEWQLIFTMVSPLPLRMPINTPICWKLCRR